MDGIGLGVELNDALLNSKDTFFKRTTSNDL
jgi:hypothetical protein